MSEWKYRLGSIFFLRGGVGFSVLRGGVNTSGVYHRDKSVKKGGGVRPYGGGGVHFLAYLKSYV